MYVDTSVGTAMNPLWALPIRIRRLSESFVPFQSKQGSRGYYNHESNDDVAKHPSDDGKDYRTLQ
jgi:hypothetical protein